MPLQHPPGRRIAVAALLGAAALLSGCAPEPAAELPAELAAELPWPDAPVAAAIGAADGATVLAHADEGWRPLASTAKLVTALVVLEAHPLGPGEEGAEIEIGPEAAARTAEMTAQGASVLPIGAGGSLSQRSLIAGMLVASASNYAEILVTWAFGSETAFLERAEAWTAEHGLASTHLADASGLRADTVGTAEDLVRIGRLALDHALVAELVASPSVQVGAAAVENTNLLLQDPSFIGLKTGTLDGAGHALVFARTADPADPAAPAVVGAVLGEASAGFARKHAEELSGAALAALTDPDEG